MKEKNTFTRENDKIDVAALWRKVCKRWYLFAGSLFVCVALVMCYLKVADDKYAVSADVMVTDDNGGGGGVAMMMAQSFSLDGMFGGGAVNDEILILSSYSLMRDVVKQLDLNVKYATKTGFMQKEKHYKNSPLIVDIPESMADTLSRGFTVKVNVNAAGDCIKIQLKKGFFTTLAEQEASSFPVTVAYGEGFVIDKTPFYTPGEELKFVATVNGYDKMSEYLTENVQVLLTDKKANGISLGIKESNVLRGKDILNTIISSYDEVTKSHKNVKANNMLSFINDRLALVKKDLDEAERVLEQYKRANDLSDIATEAQIILEANHQYRKNLLEAETQYSIISMVDSFLNKPENKYSLVPVTTGLPDKGAAEAINEYNKLLLERMRLLRTAKESNLSLITLTAQIDAMRNNILNTVSKARESSNIAREDLRKQEESFRDRLRGFPEQERAYLNLKRDQQIKNELYIFLMQRREESVLALASAQSQCRVINSAYSTTKPVAPDALILLLVAFVVGLILPIIYMYGKSVLSDKFNTKKELQRITQLPIVGDIHHNTTATPIVVTSNSVVAEDFRLLRSNLQMALSKQDARILTVTSVDEGAGKSFVAANLATAMAMMGRRTVLVDLNLRNPAVADYAGISSTCGAADYLSAAIDEVTTIVHGTTFSTNLDVVLAGKISSNPSDLLISDRLVQLIDALKAQYESIILDTTSIERFADTFSLTRITDATLLVCRANHTTHRSLGNVSALIADGLLKDVLLLLNDIQDEEDTHQNVC